MYEKYQIEKNDQFIDYKNNCEIVEINVICFIKIQQNISQIYLCIKNIQ